MADPFLGEVRIFPYNFAPRGWATCQGQLISISQNTALFSILGTTYGGNGQTTFGLPDLRGRAALHPGSGSGLTARTLGEMAGTEGVALAVSQIPSHNHTMQGRNLTATAVSPSGQLLATPVANARYTNLYAATGTQTTMDGSVITSTGSGQSHENRQALLVLTPCIATQGIFPVRS